MNIKKYMQQHDAYIRERLTLTRDANEWSDLKKHHQRMIEYMQHERLIHLLVTLAFAVFLILTLFVALTTSYTQMILLMGLFLILLVPYIMHYFFLENTIQDWYKLMDAIDKKSGTLPD